MIFTPATNNVCLHLFRSIVLTVLTNQELISRVIVPKPICLLFFPPHIFENVGSVCFSTVTRSVHANDLSSTLLFLRVFCWPVECWRHLHVGRAGTVSSTRYCQSLRSSSHCYEPIRWPCVEERRGRRLNVLHRSARSWRIRLTRRESVRRYNE